MQDHISGRGRRARLLAIAGARWGVAARPSARVGGGALLAANGGWRGCRRAGLGAAEWRAGVGWPVAHRSAVRRGRGDAPPGEVLIAGGYAAASVERGTVQPRHGHLHEAHGPRPVAHRSTRRRGRGDAARRAGPDRGRLQRSSGDLVERGTVQPRHGHLHEAHGPRPVAHRSTRTARSRRRCPPGRS